MGSVVASFAVLGTGVGLGGATACGGKDADDTTDVNDDVCTDTNCDPPIDAAAPVADADPAAPDSAPGTPDAQPVVCGPDGASGAGGHHGTITIPAGDIASGAEHVYVLDGGAGHTHEITLSAADFTTLTSGGTVTVTSTLAGHTHTVMLTC